MFPYVIIFNKTITSYTIMTMIGIFVSGILCIKNAKKYKIDDNELIVFLLIASIGIIIGSHLLYGIVNLKLFFKFINNLNKVNSLNLFMACLKQIFGGSVFYGGLIGAIVICFIYAKIKKIDIKLYSYVIAPFIPLFHFFGRIGCFLYGCCYGIESNIGFTYTSSLIDMANNVRRFPVQLLEAGLNFALFILLIKLQKHDKCRDYLLELYLVIYSVMRFLLEFLRGDFYRGFVLSLSTSQIISILIFVYSFIYILRSIRIKKNLENKKIEQNL